MKITKIILLSGFLLGILVLVSACSDTSYISTNNNITNINSNANFTGDLNVGGSISNSLSHMYGLSTEIGAVPIGNVWYNVSFNTSFGDIAGVVFIDNRTLVIMNDGHYAITFGMGFKDAAPAPNAHVGMRITNNGTEIIGSYVEQDTTKQNADYWMEHTSHVELKKGDHLNMQYISDDTTVTIEQDDTWATQPFNAYGFIQEVIV